MNKLDNRGLDHRKMKSTLNQHCPESPPNFVPYGIRLKIGYICSLTYWFIIIIMSGVSRWRCLKGVRSQGIDNAKIRLNFFQFNSWLFWDCLIQLSL